MTDEDRQRAMDFIAEQTAKNSVAIDKLIETHQRAENRLALTEHRLDRDEYRLDRDERLLKLMTRAARRERRLRRGQDERFDRRYQELLESQAHTDNRLDALVDIVRQRNGG